MARPAHYKTQNHECNLPYVQIAHQSAIYERLSKAHEIKSTETKQSVSIIPIINEMHVKNGNSVNINVKTYR